MSVSVCVCLCVCQVAQRLLQNVFGRYVSATRMRHMNLSRFLRFAREVLIAPGPGPGPTPSSSPSPSSSSNR